MTADFSLGFVQCLHEGVCRPKLRAIEGFTVCVLTSRAGKIIYGLGSWIPDKRSTFFIQSVLPALYLDRPAALNVG